MRERLYLQRMLVKEIFLGGKAVSARTGCQNQSCVCVGGRGGGVRQHPPECEKAEEIWKCVKSTLLLGFVG